MDEVWKEVGRNKRFFYEISTKGNFCAKEIGSNKIVPRKIQTNNGGYFVVAANFGGKSTYFIHRLVAMAFIPNPHHKPMVDHINGDKKDNNVVNLRWATAIENNSNPNTQRRPKLNLLPKKDKSKIINHRRRPCNNFMEECGGFTIKRDNLLSKDIRNLKNVGVYYFSFDNNLTVFNVHARVTKIAKEEKRLLKAHSDYINHIVKIVVG